MLIDCMGVELEIVDGPVGIMCSGGVDSSILLYYLMKHSTSTIHIYTTGSNQKFRRNSIVAPIVVEKCIQLTENNNVVHHIHYDEAATDTSMCDAPKKDVDSGKLNRVYDGTTMNPPNEIASKFVPIFKFDYSRKEDGDNVKYYHNDTFYMPWANTNKQGIAEMYRDENLIESLLPVTRSCEYDPTCEYFIENDIKDPELGHCGECWWCKEKEWGFK